MNVFNKFLIKIGIGELERVIDDIFNKLANL